MAYRSCTSSPEIFDAFLASPPKNETLRRLKSMIDWGALRAVVHPAYKHGGPGRLAIDPVLMIRLTLLQRLYGLSDPGVVEEAADRLSFREFLDLRAGDTVPDDTTIVRFRERLRAHGLHDALWKEVHRQLAAMGVAVREGSIKIVDATLVEAATRPPSANADVKAKALDPDADFTVKKGRPHHGYKMHAAQDRETGIITGVALTPASVHDSQVFEEFIDGTEAEVMADKAYDSAARRRWLSKLGVKCSIMRRGRRNMPVGKWWTGRNRAIGRVRGFIEGTFATLKRRQGCGRAAYRGLARVYEQMLWSVMAYNLRRAAALQGE